MDYINVALHIPLYCFHLGVAVWGFIITLPWPAKHEWFGSLAIFLGLYPVRVVLAALVPEKKVYKRLKKRKSVPSQGEHQGAAAASHSMIHHL